MIMLLCAVAQGNSRQYVAEANSRNTLRGVSPKHVLVRDWVRWVTWISIPLSNPVPGSLVCSQAVGQPLCILYRLLV
jgi:hypothetical protein